jgi:two-component system response regulator YesN
MLELDGLEMIERLQNEGVQAKFVILSGYAEFEYAKRGIRLGVKSYLNKPIEEKELQECVNMIIKEIEAERTREIQPLSGPPLDIPKKSDVISEIKQYVTENFNKNISLADLSNRFYINLHYLSQLFKEKTGQTYLDFLTQVRIERSKELLEKSELKLYEICHMVGYSDATHFSKVFEKLAGCKPAEYRKSRRN